MAILKTKRLLLTCKCWLGEVITEVPEYAYLKALGFKKIVPKMRIYLVETFSFDYTDSQGKYERINIFMN
jgi:hypothetical protein